MNANKKIETLEKEIDTLIIFYHVTGGLAPCSGLVVAALIELQKNLAPQVEYWESFHPHHSFEGNNFSLGGRMTHRTLLFADP